MSKKYIVSLREEEQKELRIIIGKRNEKAQGVKRAYVLLGADENGEGLCDTEIARRYKVTVRCIEGIRKRFVERGTPQFFMERNAPCSKKRPLTDGWKPILSLSGALNRPKVTVPGHCSSWLTTWFV